MQYQKITKKYDLKIYHASDDENNHFQTCTPKNSSSKKNHSISFYYNNSLYGQNVIHKNTNLIVVICFFYAIHINNSSH